MTRHPLDAISLVFGIAFTGLGLLLLGTDVDVTDLGVRWLLPSLALLAGVVLAIAGVTLASRERDDDAAPRDDPANGD